VRSLGLRPSSGRGGPKPSNDRALDSGGNPPGRPTFGAGANPPVKRGRPRGMSFATQVSLSKL
jgi:hypothetical protein